MEQREHLPIGKLLEKFGYINQTQINVALNVQKANRMFLGEILQKLDFVTTSEIAEAIALQYDMEYIDLDSQIITNEALNLVSYNFAQSKLILPIHIKDGVLIVAVENVNDLDTMDYLQKTCNMPVKYVVADKNKIQNYIELRYYQLSNPIEVQIEAIIDALNNYESVDVVHLVELLLNNAIKDKATDIHITPDNDVIYVFFRIDGVMHHYYAMPKEILQQIVSRIKILSGMDISEHRLPQDGGFSHEFIGIRYDLRVSSLPTDHGENIVMRLLSSQTSAFNLTSLGFAKDEIDTLKELFNKPYGIVLVTGPTGSGKTTTLYSLLRHINFIEKNVLTVEDPIEYRFSFVRQTEVNEKAGYTFAKAIKHFMRQDPDAMLVGEMRDEETAQLATRAAITGHLVLSTLHTNDAAGAIPRLLDLSIKDYLLSSSLLSVMAQRLIRKLCPHCKKEIIVHKQQLQFLGFEEAWLAPYPDEITIYDEVGCEHCKNTGYNGREAVLEIMVVDDAIKEMITSGVSPLEIHNYSKSKGMVTMKHNGLKKVISGVTSLRELRRVIV